MEKKENETSGREISISRLFDAPLELVWTVWTQPEHLKNWWGPSGFTNTIHRMDVKPGGQWDLTMHGPDGTDYENESIFKEVVHHKKIVYEHLTWPKFITTVEFEAQGRRTFIKWQMLFESTEERAKTIQKHKADEGLKQNMEKLDAYLQKEQ
ncbi:MAG: SRPBCC family protein [Bacteroidia bacterium]